MLELAEVETVQEAMFLHSKAESLRYLYKKADATKDIQNEAAEARLRIERRIGGMLMDMPKRNGARPSDMGLHHVTPSLSDLGIDKAKSSRYQSIATIPDTDFDEYIETTKANDDDITTADVLRLARKYKSNGNGHNPKFSSIIKPSDNWTFPQPYYKKTTTHNSHGYIAGDIYANVFWYYVKPGDLVVDPMAGSGIAKYVYDDRSTWMLDNMYDFDLRLFDLTPQEGFIEQHDLLTGFPVEHPDYIFMDIPYYGMANGAYSDKENDLANETSLERFCDQLRIIAQHCGKAQENDTLCTVMTPNYTENKSHRIMIVPRIIDIWQNAGYIVHDMVFASRRIQQQQSFTMGLMNNLAKETRLMLTDMSVILTFKR